MDIFVFQYYGNQNGCLKRHMDQKDPGTSEIAALTFSTSQNDLTWSNDGPSKLAAALESDKPLVVVCGEQFYQHRILGCRTGSSLARHIKSKRPDAYVLLYTAILFSEPPEGVDYVLGKMVPVEDTVQPTAEHLVKWLIHLTQDTPRPITPFSLPG